MLVHWRLDFFRNVHNDQETIIYRRWCNKSQTVLREAAHYTIDSVKIDNSYIFSNFHCQRHCLFNIVNLMQIFVVDYHFKSFTCLCRYRCPKSSFDSELKNRITNQTNL